MKRFTAGLLTAAMSVSLLAGCGGNDSGTQSSGSGGSEAAGGTEASAGSEEAGAINFDEEPYEVVIENLTLGTDMPDLEMVEEAVNEITLPEINCTVKLLNIHIADHVTRLSLMAAG